MIKQILLVFIQNKTWLLAITAMNVLFGIYLWLLNEQQFILLFPLILLGTVLSYGFISFWLYCSNLRKKEMVLHLLQSSDIYQDSSAFSFFSKEEQEILEAFQNKIKEKNDEENTQHILLMEYEEFIEAWAHDIKTPLSLMTFVLDNRKDEIPLVLYQRFEYIRTKMQEDVEKMLYYSRLKSNHANYVFAYLSLHEICRDILQEYQYLMSEQGIQSFNEVGEFLVLSDKNGLSFLIKQIISNAVKYSREDSVNPFIRLSASLEENSNRTILTISDNGMGVKSYDLPFLFDKGFTGETDEKKKHSTGMGLYLAKQAADHLNIEIIVSDEYQEGFQIILCFPDVTIDSSS